MTGSMNFKFLWLDTYTKKSENLSLTFSEMPPKIFPPLQGEGEGGDGVLKEMKSVRERTRLVVQ
jgi:hypothetical protein